MDIIFKSFFLSFPVMARMVFPLIGIFLASIVVWFVASILTLGYASHVSGPVTSMFIMMFGIRAAFELCGERQRFDLKALATLSVAYGVCLMVVKFLLVKIAAFIAIVVTEWNLREIGSIFTIETAEEAVQTQFGLHLITIWGVLSLFFLVLAPTALAVPIAAATHSTGLGAPNRSFFEGFARSFVPLFLIFTIAYALMLFFGLGAIIYGLMSFLYGLALFASGFEDPRSIDFGIITKGFVSCFVLFWLHAWTWSASALAFLKYNKKADAERVVAQAATTIDLRALRKSRA